MIYVVRRSVAKNHLVGIARRTVCAITSSRPVRV
jgi:hypothetical protein